MIVIISEKINKNSTREKLEDFMSCSKWLHKKETYIIIYIIWFIVQRWTQASKLGPLKQKKQEKRDKNENYKQN